MSSERRHRLRSTVALDATLATVAGARAVTVLNISSGGALVLDDAPTAVPAGQRAVLEVALPDWAGRDTLRLHAVVRNSATSPRGTHTGLAFAAVTDDDQALLSRLALRALRSIA